MLAHPFDRQRATRYPDETLVPTSMVHLASSYTYTAPSDKPFATILRQKALMAVPMNPPSGGYNIGTIGLPSQFVPGSGQQVPDLWSAGLIDYGQAQKQWTPLSVTDRTLACAIRARITGLPTSTFMPSGTLYFLQLQSRDLGSVYADSTMSTLGVQTTGDDIMANGESACIRAVEAGKGFSVTVAELGKESSLHIPFVPQGPMSFVFSDTNAAGAQVPGGWAPYLNQQGAADQAPMSTVVSAPTTLVILGFGLQAGMQIRFDYAHHIEYIPSSGAAGLVETVTELPSHASREGISHGSHVLATSIQGQTTGSRIKAALENFAVTQGPALARGAFNLLKGPVGSALMPGIKSSMLALM